MKETNIYLPPFVPNIEFEERLKELLEQKALGELIKLDYHSFFDNLDFFSLLDARFQILANDESTNLFCYSLGANLGLILAKKYPNIKNLVLMSTPLEPFHITQNIKDLGGIITNRSSFDINNYSNGYVHEKTLQIVKGISLRRIMIYGQSLVLAKEALSSISTSTLIIVGNKDSLVSPTGSEIVYNALKENASLIEVENGRHPILLSSKSDILANEIEKFITKEKNLTKRKVI